MAKPIADDFAAIAARLREIRPEPPKPAPQPEPAQPVWMWGLSPADIRALEDA